MSLLDRHECCTCFKLTGWAGDRARRDPLRKHVACTCTDETEQFTQTLGDPFLNKLGDGRSGALRAEPSCTVSALRAPAAIAKGEVQ